MKKIGIMGGTFNPPHIGHTLMAKEIQVQCSLDEIWFLISGKPPHKEGHEITSNKDRIKMVQAAIQEEKDFSVSTIELEREGTSYTYDTMKELINLYPDYQFYFIIGGDMIEYLPKWYRIEDLVKFVQFIGIKRPGYSTQTPYPIELVETIQIELSSSMIRQRLQEGRNITYLVHREVEKYIREQGLYGEK